MAEHQVLHEQAVQHHALLNLRRLLRSRYALSGVDGYGFLSCGDQATLWRWPPSLDVGQAAESVLRLECDAPLPAQPLLLLLPLPWALGNAAAERSHCWPPVRVQAGRIESLTVLSVSPPAQPNPSGLARLWHDYVSSSGVSSASVLVSPAPSAAVRLLQLERRLRRLVAPDCWQGVVSLPRPWPLEQWLSDPDLDPQELGASLVALLHLLPDGESQAFAAALAELLLVGLDRPDPTGAQRCCRLLESLVGGINSRDPQLVAIGQRLRAAGVDHALALDDPAERGLILMRLLPSPAADRQERALQALADSFDGLVVAAEEAQARGDRQARRCCQLALQTTLRTGQRNLVLLRQLVLRLAPHTCYRIPSLLPPSCCVIWLKALLLLDSGQVSGLDASRRSALMALFERCLPRVWWQEDLLVRLLHDLRRFDLELGWLGAAGCLLPSLMVLHERAWIPALASDGESLLRTQLTLLLRLSPRADQRDGLLRTAAGVGKAPLLRLLDRQDEQAIVQAAAAGLHDRTLLLLRLLAERRGVPGLLPESLPGDGVAASFAATLQAWAELGLPTAAVRLPVTVLITTHEPRLDLLRQSLESLALQSAAPEEVLLIDDGSSLVMAEALRRLCDDLIASHALPLRLHRETRNLGQYRCRNLGLQLMRTEVLAIQDDDDLSHPLRLARQWESLGQGAVAVYAGHLRLAEATGWPQPDGPAGSFIGDGITTLMVRRRTAVSLGGFYPVRSRGDVEFRERLRHRYGETSLRQLEAPLYLMRGSAGTVSSSFEYGCSLALSQWRSLIDRKLLV